MNRSERVGRSRSIAGGFGQLRRVLGRNPNERVRPDSDMPDARKRDVRGADPESLPRGLRKDGLAGLFCLLYVSVILDGDGGIGKLDGGDVDHIAPDHEFLTLAFDCIDRVADRVPRRRNRRDSRYKFQATIKW